MADATATPPAACGINVACAPVVDRPTRNGRLIDFAVLLAQAQQQVELLGEQFVVLVHRRAEEREELSEGAAAGDDLGAAVAERVERWLR
jgi:hypothetical protein